MEYVNILGRILFGGYFVYNGINHFINLKMLTGYAASKKVPMANIAVMGAGLMLLAGGLSYILNFHVTAGTIILLLFLIPTSFMMHNFWAVQDIQQKMGDTVNFTKNLALIGALLLFLSIRYAFGFAL
ncbi:MAG: DoxX family protein [Ignavibacteriales bacterium]|nr:DoxX family protein [Ignavibacteriales bacterium]